MNDSEHISFVFTRRNGLFIGVQWHYAIYVINSRWKLINGKFVKVPPMNVWHLDIGLLTHTFSIYIRKKTK